MSTAPTPIGGPARLVLFLLGIVEEFGAGASLALACPVELFKTRSLMAKIHRELAWIFAMGMPIVAFLHVGLGSFLSMQAFYGATFVEGTGAVVGVGLVRNAAPLISGLLLAGILSGRIIFEMRRSRDDGADAVLPRLVAAMIAGPVLAAWGALVGTVVGWQVSQTMMGVSTPTFFLRFWDMLWMIDVASLPAKGALFGLAGSLFACVEGRKEGGRDWLAVQSAAVRATCFASVTILFLNSTWFLIVYVGGAPFSLLAD